MAIYMKSIFRGLFFFLIVENFLAWNCGSNNSIFPFNKIPFVQMKAISCSLSMSISFQPSSLLFTYVNLSLSLSIYFQLSQSLLPLSRSPSHFSLARFLATFFNFAHCQYSQFDNKNSLQLFMHKFSLKFPSNSRFKAKQNWISLHSRVLCFNYIHIAYGG